MFSLDNASTLLWTRQTEKFVNATGPVLISKLWGCLFRLDKQKLIGVDVAFPDSSRSYHMTPSGRKQIQTLPTLLSLPAAVVQLDSAFYNFLTPYMQKRQVIIQAIPLNTRTSVTIVYEWSLDMRFQAC